jgi:hypothetical protein
VWSDLQGIALCLKLIKCTEEKKKNKKNKEKKEEEEK